MVTYSQQFKLKVLNEHLAEYKQARELTVPTVHRYMQRYYMAWTYLILAGLFEIGWPLGLKMAQESTHRVMGIVIAISCMVTSGGLLWLAQKHIPLGTSYAIWTGIGAAGTFLVGVMYFGDASSVGRYLGVLLIIVGVITLKVAH